MRIVAVADTHLFTDDIAIPDGDVFLHAGDMCRRGDLEELGVAAAWIESLPHRDKIVVAGNHDWGFQADPAAARAVFSRFHYLEDSELQRRIKRHRPVLATKPALHELTRKKTFDEADSQVHGNFVPRARQRVTVYRGAPALSQSVKSLSSGGTS